MTILGQHLPMEYLLGTAFILGVACVVVLFLAALKWSMDHPIPRECLMNDPACTPENPCDECREPDPWGGHRR